MQALVAGGADPKMTMPNGATALMLAAGMDSATTENRRGIAVIDFGRVETDNQVLPSVTAAFNLNREVIAANQAGDTALHAAVTHRYESVIRFLADHGADVNAKNKGGLTPLAMLITQGKAAKQVVLASASSASSAGESSVDYTVRIAALLRGLGASE